MKRFIKITTALIISILISLLVIQVDAATPTKITKYFNLYGSGNGRASGFYAINTANGDLSVIKVLETNKNGADQHSGDDDVAVYCYKAGAGFGSSSSSAVTTYSNEFDLLTGFSALEKSYGSTYGTSGTRSVWPSTNANYNSSIWLLENFVDVDSTDAEINTWLSQYGLSMSKFASDTTKARDMIESIQQSALWYFTNPSGESYHIEYDADEDVEFNLKYASTKTATKTAFADEVASAIDSLFSQLITNASNNSSTEATTYATATNAYLNKSSATSTKSGNYFYYGPYTFTYGSGVTISSASITSNGSTLTNYALVSSIASPTTTYQGSTLAAKLKNANGKAFYIRVPASSSYNSINVTISTTAEKRTIKAYSVDSSALNSNQPVVVVEKETTPNNFVFSNSIEITGSYTVKIRKEDEDGNGLTGAKFTTKLPGGSSNTFTMTSAEQTLGTVTITDISTADVLTVTEVTPPSGYASMTGTLTISIGKKESNGSYVASTVSMSGTGSASVTLKNGVITVTVKNKKLEGGYNLKLLKVDENSNPLSGAVFSVKLPSLSAATSVTADSNGMCDLGTVSISEAGTDTITISETKAPNGYEKLINNLTLTVTKTVSGTSFIASKVALSDTTNASVSLKDSTITVTIKNAKPKIFDLALRKYITHIAGEAVATRVPVLPNGEAGKLVTSTATFDKGTTAEKDHTKTPLMVKTGDVVRYTIRIYNEGNVDGYATEITDYIPEGLELTSNSEINEKYGWMTSRASDKVVTTAYLSSNKIPAVASGSVNYADVEIECTVVADASKNLSMKNVAEITAAKNDYDLDDIDSTPKNVTETGSDYSVSTSEQGKGYEDDDDYEELYIRVAGFDLALRKFIVTINGEEVDSREPQITATEISNLYNRKATFDRGTTAEKTHTKTPLKVETGDKVVYTIRVYNEGKTVGEAREITDYLPDGLELTADSKINKEYEWVADGKEVTTYYLANTQIPAVTADKLSYEDVQIECTVTAKSSSGKVSLKNVAEITDDGNDEGLEDEDSTPDQVIEKGSNYSVTTSEHGRGYEDDDDYEELYIAPKDFDLALRKFITKVDGEAITDREPNITTDYMKSLAEGTAKFDNGTTTEKHHSKTPLKIYTGSKVVYTIRVYNEGNIDGYATEITDYLPEGMTLTENSTINEKYGWKANGQEITTDFLKDYVIKAFEVNGSTYTLSYVDVQIECTVTATSVTGLKLKNVAEITKSYNEDGVPDRDSTTDNVTEKGDGYNPGTSEDGKGYEDDDDYEELFLGRFDLALRKFITAVNDTEVTSRIPKVDKSNFGKEVDGKVVTTCTYTHTKEPVKVATTDIVTYTIRIYNEGTVAGYANVVKDDIPDGLEFLPDNETNKTYRWKMLDASGNETTDVSKAKYIVTDKLSKEQGTETDGVNSNLIKAFDSTTMDSPDYRDIKVAFKVTEPNTSDRIIINYAQITDDEDEDGNEVDDDDSTPDEWIEGEDDQDIEKIYVKYFDLALRKWVTHAIVIENGVQKEMATGHTAEDDPESVVKVELNKERLNSTVVKFRYSIRITNEGEIEGYATEITDYIPSGLRFNQADNPLWKEKSDGVITTDQLKDTLLKPGEQAFVTVTLTWVNSENNMGVMTNVAEISEDDNPYDTPDIDSVPNNKKSGEDDIDDAPVALVTMTGSGTNYLIFILSGLTLIGAGIFLIKKYVI